MGAGVVEGAQLFDRLAGGIIGTQDMAIDPHVISKPLELHFVDGRSFVLRPGSQEKVTGRLDDVSLAILLQQPTVKLARVGLDLVVDLGEGTILTVAGHFIGDENPPPEGVFAEAGLFALSGDARGEGAEESGDTQPLGDGGVPFAPALHLLVDDYGGDIVLGSIAMPSSALFGGAGTDDLGTGSFGSDAVTLADIIQAPTDTVSSPGITSPSGGGGTSGDGGSAIGPTDPTTPDTPIVTPPVSGGGGGGSTTPGGGEVIGGTPGGDTLIGGDGDDTIDGGDGDDSIGGGDGDDSIGGGNGDDTIDGGDGDDTIDGGAGNDTIYGGAGNDTIYGGDGNDTIDGGDGNDTLAGGDGDDSVAGGNGDDVVYGNAGNDTLDGGAGSDTLYGGDGNDSVTGGSGSDVLYGEDGDDTLSGGTGPDTLYGGNGNDVLDERGDTSPNLLDGGSGNDTLYAGNGGDTLYGGAGDDSLVGGAGNDYLDGGAGNDTISGAAGADSYVIRIGDPGNDRLVGFQDGTDKMVLVDASGGALTGAALTAAAATFLNARSTSGGDLVLDADTSTVGGNQTIVGGAGMTVSYADIKGLADYSLGAATSATIAENGGVGSGIPFGRAGDLTQPGYVEMVLSGTPGVDYDLTLPVVAGVSFNLVAGSTPGTSVLQITYAVGADGSGASIQVDPIDNATSDGDKVITYQLQNPQNGGWVGAAPSGSITISDDETPGLVMAQDTLPNTGLITGTDRGDQITLGGTGGLHSNGGLTVLLKEGNDAFALSNTTDGTYTATSNDGLRIIGGDGYKQITVTSVAGTGSTANSYSTLSNFAINTGDGGANVRVQNEIINGGSFAFGDGAVTFDWQQTGGHTQNSGILGNSNISYISGRGNDTVTIGVTGQTGAYYNGSYSGLTVNAGDGNNNIFLQANGNHADGSPLSGQQDYSSSGKFSNLNVIAGSGDDDVTVESKNNNAQNAGGVSGGIDLGAGNNLLLVDVSGNSGRISDNDGDGNSEIGSASQVALQYVVAQGGADHIKFVVGGGGTYGAGSLSVQSLDTGAGNDTIEVDQTGTPQNSGGNEQFGALLQIVGTAGAGDDQIIYKTTVAMGGDVDAGIGNDTVDVTFTSNIGTSGAKIAGNAGDDLIAVHAASGTRLGAADIHGDAGNDTITLDGGALVGYWDSPSGNRLSGFDLSGGTGNDSISATAALFGYLNNDYGDIIPAGTLDGGDGNDTIHAETTGAFLAVTIAGGAGDDQISGAGQARDDQYHPGTTQNYIVAGDGNDQITVDDGLGWRIEGGIGFDKITLTTAGPIDWTNVASAATTRIQGIEQIEIQSSSTTFQIGSQEVHQINGGGTLVITGAIGADIVLRQDTWTNNGAVTATTQTGTVSATDWVNSAGDHVQVQDGINVTTMMTHSDAVVASSIELHADATAAVAFVSEVNQGDAVPVGGIAPAGAILVDSDARSVFDQAGNWQLGADRTMTYTVVGADGLTASEDYLQFVASQLAQREADLGIHYIYVPADQAGGDALNNQANITVHFNDAAIVAFMGEDAAKDTLGVTFGTDQAANDALLQAAGIDPAKATSIDGDIFLREDLLAAGEDKAAGTFTQELNHALGAAQVSDALRAELDGVSVDQLAETTAAAEHGTGATTLTDQEKDLLAKDITVSDGTTTKTVAEAAAEQANAHAGDPLAPPSTASASEHAQTEPAATGHLGDQAPASTTSVAASADSSHSPADMAVPNQTPPSSVAAAEDHHDDDLAAIAQFLDDMAAADHAAATGGVVLAVQPAAPPPEPPPPPPLPHDPEPVPHVV